ncbi:efflux RND transporter periplasmic adaptor subunit [Allofranklinella schreckenbergeri]|uniref:Efflux RND transporter periplasmic adaptor subunit n=1 Tax=Allofranklinella schreckenbergeri TaxID=1076744 RepID=A0A3M6R518_9BURK|nr:efflux RND transporter periplasmic adaptor subunit [Allofranklinella schreckenbergeri]RMX10316.1 efflux RND transporter periplasmic adaptor subunit [Allofranklinella schreckenbergeri]
MALSLSPQLGRMAVVVAAISGALVLCACGESRASGPQEQAQSGQQQGQQGQPPSQARLPEVRVVTVRSQSVGTHTELPGRLAAHRVADVRPRVGGIIQKRLFKEGSYVKAGQALYQLDDAPYVAALESARAQLASAQAALAKAKADLLRYKPLVAANAISQQEYDSAVATQRSAEASVKAAHAAIKSAQINVNYSRITAPISGYIGQSYVSEGALVTAGDANKLATIQQTHPMYVNVTQSANEVMQLKQDVADGKRQLVDGAMQVGIKFENGKEYPHKGRLLFADLTVNESTGQVTLRAEIPNPDNVLLPGLYVRVGLPQGDIGNAFLVPQQAITRGKQDVALIVDEQGQMQPRMVTVGGQQGAYWIVTGGLQDGDKVIVDGTMIAGMSGAKQVQTREWTPPGAAAPAAGAAPGSNAGAAPAGADAAAQPGSAAQ